MCQICHTWDSAGGGGSLLQYQYNFLHVAVYEMESECAPDRGPPWECPHREVYAAGCLWEGYMVGPGPIWGVRGGIPKISPGHPVLSLPVGGQIPRLKFHVAIRAADLLTDSLTVGVPLPHHPEAVGLCRVTPKLATRLIIHAHHLGYIFAESHTDK